MSLFSPILSIPCVLHILGNQAPRLPGSQAPSKVLFMGSEQSSLASGPGWRGPRECHRLFLRRNSFCVLVPNRFIMSTTWVGFLESLSPTLVLKSSPINLQSGWFRDAHHKYFSPVKYCYPHLTLSVTPDTVTHIEALGKLFFFPFPPLPFSSLDWRPSYLKHPGIKIIRYLVMLLDLSSHNIHEPL